MNGASAQKYSRLRVDRWVRNEHRVGQIRQFVSGVYGDDPVVMVAAELKACLSPSDIDFDDIRATFGLEVDRLMRQMDVPRTAGELTGDLPVHLKKAKLASAAGQTILLACLISDTTHSMSHIGKILHGRAVILDLVEGLPYFDKATPGLIDLAEQIIEIEG